MTAVDPDIRMIETRIQVLDSPRDSDGDSFLSGWLFVPSVYVDTPTLVVCTPGGSYTKAYYHQVVLGYPGYSFAEWLVKRGSAVLAVDHLGTGDSSRPADGSKVTVGAMASVVHEAVQAVRSRLSLGTLSASLPPYDFSFIVGVGHSLGGCVTLVQQAKYRTYDAIVNLGYPCQQNRDIYDYDRHAWLHDDAPQRWNVGYTVPTRQFARDFFHSPDVPEEVLLSDDKTATVVPDGIREMAYPGGATEYASQIEVPVFLGWGEFDASPGHGDPTFYRRSNDVTLFVLPGSAHCHNTSTRRHELWERIARWIAVHSAGPAEASA